MPYTHLRTRPLGLGSDARGSSRCRPIDAADAAAAWPGGLRAGEAEGEEEEDAPPDGEEGKGSRQRAHSWLPVPWSVV